MHTLKPNVGGHHYPGASHAFAPINPVFFTSDCAYGCGCWMGSSRSGGPAGIDPFKDCPMNSRTLQIDIPTQPQANAFPSQAAYQDAFQEWREKTNYAILAAIPAGHVLKSMELAEIVQVRHVANITIEQHIITATT